MSNVPPITLMAVARAHWRSFLPAWVFPLFFLYGGLAADRFGHPALFFWVVAIPLFFWSFGRAASPWLRQQVRYWQVAFWAMVVPFLIWVFAVFLRLAILGVHGAANAA